jgi:hypothetical protein
MDKSKDVAMQAPPDIWEVIFDQTPTIIRWALGILTLGLFTLAAWIWRSQRADIERIERQMHSRITREIGGVHERINGVNSRLDTMNGHLITISQNTSRMAGDSK